ncbi:MAG: helix-hairpin-helix domain-containing protein [Bacillota bacterium]|jgi:competence protein ComEA
MWDFTSRQKFAAFVLLSALAVGGIVLIVKGTVNSPVVVYSHPATASLIDTGSSGKESTSGGEDSPLHATVREEAEETEELVVHVCGAVKNPGVYTLPKGARIADAVNLAGGLEDSAMEEAVNMAMKVEDSMQINIPHISSVPVSIEASVTIPDSASQMGKVNLNTATLSQLESLPGIGPALAERILEFRAAYGKFDRPEDLLNVSGIGEKKYAAIKDLVTVF